MFSVPETLQLKGFSQKERLLFLPVPAPLTQVCEMGS